MTDEWITDLRRWRARPLAERLEVLRRHYCTGPCGQSSGVIATRAATYQTLTEAIDLISRRAEPGEGA